MSTPDPVNEQEQHSRQRGPWRVLLVFVACLTAIILLTSLFVGLPDRREYLLPDGSTLVLKDVSVADVQDYQLNPHLNWRYYVADLLPARFQPGLIGPAYMALKHEGQGTHLLVTTLHREASANGVLDSLRVFSASGSGVSARRTRPPITHSNLTDQVWAVKIWPRRSPTLTLEFVYGGTNRYRIELPNPLGTNFPAWSDPPPLPQTVHHDRTTVKLASFKVFPLGRRAVPDYVKPGAMRFEHINGYTWLSFGFIDSDGPSGAHELLTVTLADATGNHWLAYDSFDRSYGRAHAIEGGTDLKAPGELWPDENSWNIQATYSRRRSFPTNEVWQLPPIPLPAARQWSALTNAITIGDVTARLVMIADATAPPTNNWFYRLHFANPRRVIETLADSDSRLFALALEVDAKNPDIRLAVADARTDNGLLATTVERRGLREREQSVILRIPPGATELHLQLAFPKLETVEFFARPDFVLPERSP